MGQLICIICLTVLLILCLIRLSVNAKRIKLLKERSEQLKRDADALDSRLEGLQKILLADRRFLGKALSERAAAECDKAVKRVDEATTANELRDAQIELDRLAAGEKWINDYLA